MSNVVVPQVRIAQGNHCNALSQGAQSVGFCQVWADYHSATHEPSKILPHVVPAPGALRATGLHPNRLTGPALPSHYAAQSLGAFNCVAKSDFVGAGFGEENVMTTQRPTNPRRSIRHHQWVGLIVVGLLSGADRSEGSASPTHYTAG